MLTAVSVKALAEFVHRRGDLYPALGGRVTGEEGIATQKRMQRNRGGSYQREVAVAGSHVCGGLEIAVSGRVDGCDLSVPLVEEIKTTRADPEAAQRAVGSAHWAQARLYAALLADAHPGHAQFHIRLLYCHPDTEDSRSFEEVRAASWLKAYLVSTLEQYAVWLRAQHGYESRRNRWLGDRAFPYGAFRVHQRALAGRVFQAFEAGEHLLLEAPTGSGKTMGVLYPALKALSAGTVDRLFFLTSRGTGALAAMKAADDLAEHEQQIRVVDLLAKEKVCPVEGTPCNDSCGYSVGYYDRIGSALPAALALGRLDRESLRAVAEAHQVCPFELSLDAALWADLIIGDYNYLIDPVVRLQRFMNDDRLGVLIDESHQLAERTRNMLSLTVHREAVRAALAEDPPATIARRLRSVDRALMDVRRPLADGQVVGEAVIETPTSFLRAARRALEALAEEEIELHAWPACRQVLFDLSRWNRARSWASVEESQDAWQPSDGFRFLAEVADGRRGSKGVRLRLVCLDPAPYLQGVLSEYGPHVRFSGTLTPLDLHQTLHGQTEQPAERAESPFAPGQLETLVVTDLPVYYRQRTASLPRLAELVRTTVSAGPGNYLVALPSFEYLEQLHEVLAVGDLEVHTQVPGMDEAARTGFLDRFQADRRSRVGLIVLGGLFAESVDFSHAPLAGVICVGVGLPPASRQKEEMRAYYEGLIGEGGGDMVAYQQPAMTKVLQMAGRLLRSPEDRGVLLLVDDRFSRPAYQRFFPRHWQPRPVRAREVALHLENFWKAASALPRLRSSQSGTP